MTSTQNETESPKGSISIKPSPRILRVLGDIEFEPWQCLAELIDNAFDDFLEVYRSGAHWPDGFTVSVTLPDRAGADASIIIEDTGRGMSVEQLNNAVRAGWSSNDRFNKLGLFGMGFNIATARLGRLARISSTRAHDAEWLGVEIDLDKIEDDFEVPLVRAAKSTPLHHGTRVEITHLEPSRAGWLGKNAGKIRTTLGDVYSHLLSTTPFTLYVDGVRVTPRRACIWDATRSVTYGTGSTAEQLPAVIEINESLPDAEACLTCGNWQPPQQGECSECGAATLEPRTRRIRGWLGIQRYLHRSEYGIDFLRNGRKILRYEKRLFSWTDPNDPLGTPELEYPVELGQGGRIVGEIHLDHVPVNYQKNAFEWSDRGWISAVRFLRGEGPLLPKRARALGYPPNDTPLAKLHRGYRRNDPGYRCLIPGNRTGPIHSDTLEWRDKFHKGVPEFQTDAKWWEAVVYHESKEAKAVADSPASANVLDELGLTFGNQEASGELGPDHANPSGPSANPSSILKPRPTAGPETERQKVDRLRSQGEIIPPLSKDFGIADFGPGIDVTSYAVRGGLLDANGTTTPVLIWRETAKKYRAFIDVSHQIFQSFPIAPGVLLAVELANLLKVRSESKLTISQVAAMILDQRLSDLRVEHGYLASQAQELLGSIRQHMSEAISSNPERAWQHLSIEERATTETNMVVAGSPQTMEQLEQTGEFVLYVPPTFLARLAEHWPDAFFDAKVFKSSFSGVSTAAGKHLAVGRVVSYLYDAAVIAAGRPGSNTALARCALSIQLLRAELAHGGDQ